MNRPLKDKHFKEKHDEQDHPYFCKQCGEGFWIYSNLRWHRETHKTVPLLRCRFCNSGIHGANAMMAHVQTQHKDLKIMKCHKCNKEFWSQRYCDSHMRLVHPTKRCRKCNAVFQSKEELDVHYKIHEQERTCNICEKKFGSKNELKDHMNTHTVKASQPMLSENNIGHLYMMLAIFTNVKFVVKHSQFSPT